jgi:hypothetical protein
LPCPPIDSACIHRLLHFAVGNNWGRGRRRAARCQGGDVNRRMAQHAI